MGERGVRVRSELQATEGEWVPHLTVSARVCQEGPALCKVTEVRLGTQVVVIRDLFSAAPAPGQPQKSGIFHKDRKNLVKNIGKAFRSWLLFNESAREDCRASRPVVDELFSRHNFNNRLVLALASPPLKSVFAEFLMGPAQQWLQESKIHDKHAHFNAILAYRRLCLSPQAFANFRVLRRGE